MVKTVSIDFAKHTHTKGQEPQKIIEKTHKAKTCRPLVMPIKKKGEKIQKEKNNRIQKEK